MNRLSHRPERQPSTAASHENGLYIETITNSLQPDNVPNLIFTVPHDGPGPNNSHYKLNDKKIFEACQKKEPTLTPEDFATYKRLEQDIGAFDITQAICHQTAQKLNSIGLPFRIKLIGENGLHRAFDDINRRPINRDLVTHLTNRFKNQEEISHHIALRELCMEDPFEQEGPIRRCFDHAENPDLTYELELYHLSSLSTLWKTIMSTRASILYHFEGHSMWPCSPSSESLSHSKSIDEGTLGIKKYNQLIIESCLDQNHPRPDVCIITHERSDQGLIPFSNIQLSQRISKSLQQAGINSDFNNPYAGTNALTSVALTKTIERENDLRGKVVIADFNKNLVASGPIHHMTPKTQAELQSIADPISSSLVADILDEQPKFSN